MLYRGTRKHRNYREVRASNLEMAQIAIGSTNGKKELTKKVKEMNDLISDQVRELLNYSNPEITDVVFQQLEEEVFPKFPSPMGRLMKILEVCRKMDASVDKPVWQLKIMILKDRISAETDPNKYYAGGAVV